MNELMKNKETITSLELVEQINIFRQREGKSELEHKTMMRTIRDEFEEEIGENKIVPSSYINSQNKEQPMFVLTFAQAKQVLVRESKTVRKAIIKYIETLEEQLNNAMQLSTKDKLLLQLFSNNQVEVANAHKQLVAIEVEEATTPLIATIEEQKPMVDFTNTVLKSSDSILVRELAKIANDENCWVGGQNKLYDKLREWKMIMKNSTEPYQSSIDNGYFVVEEKVIKTPYGEKLSSTTKITPRGQVYIIQRLKKENK